MRILLAFLFAAAACCAHAAPSVFLEDHTWLELRAAIAAGKSVA